MKYDIQIWFFIVFFPLIPIVFRTLMAIDVSKIFKKNSVREIRLLFMFTSIIIAFLVSEAFMRFLERLVSFFGY
ncbi:MAG: DUF1146 domain-containing protein [Acholeplasmataceae bacterium]|nr:DUF1146 domain-containing protein [Acholeplasmataceae bacterium]HPT88935.1 DUF1146 family protein [Bacilli bacterium]HQA19516.1 DUF1146 family protein [Bacilli bacterium]HQD91819.1 DUF1146 family protein [Bacilli bacterium]